jgi:transposase-like protein
MVHEAIAERGERFGVVTEVARQLGIGTESLRNWVKQAEIDGGQRAGVTSEEKRRIARAGAGGARAAPRQRDPEERLCFFAAELDGRRPR